MKTILAALAAALLSQTGWADGASKNEWSHAKPARRVSGTASHRPAAVRPPNTVAAGQAYSPPSQASSGVASFGSVSRGPSQTSVVKPLRPMARSRTSGAGVFVAGGPVRGYTTEQASPASASAGGLSKIQMDKNGRSLSGAGVGKGPADTPPSAGGDASGGDPLAKIMKSLGNMFGDMAKEMSAMWGGG